MVDMSIILGRYLELRSRHAARDQRMTRVAQVRAGNTDLMAPGMFSKEWPRPVIANYIDAVARDLSEMIAPLPAFNCTILNSSDDAARKRADKRSRVVSNYVEASRLETQMFGGADNYLSYGFLPFRVEANMASSRPHIHVDDPMYAYPEFDRWGNVTAYAKRWLEPAGKIAAKYPEYAKIILSGANYPQGGSAQLEIVKWYDKDCTVLFIPDRGGLVLASVPNPVSRCPVAVAVRPSPDGEMRGQFDDVLWTYIARAYMAMLRLEAAHTAVKAPISLPDDVDELALGANATIRSQNPEKIRRIGLELPQTVFAEDAALEKEMDSGSRHPSVRSGNVDASIITGKGVQALMGGFDSQIKTGQSVIGQAMQDAVAIAFEMDEKLWGGQTKEIKGTENGTPYSLKYDPAITIKGDYTCDVTYGLMAGLDPNRALVFGLQARSDQLFSRNFLRRNMPFELNVAQEEQQIDIEEGRDALKQSIAGLVQALPMMVQQGQDPLKIVSSLTRFIDARKKGVLVEDAAAQAFAPEPEAPEGEPAAGGPDDQGLGGAEGGAPPGAPGAPGQPGQQGQVAAGINPATGQVRGVAPGQAGQTPGGRPDMQEMLAGLTNGGKANLQANVLRRKAF